LFVRLRLQALGFRDRSEVFLLRRIKLVGGCIGGSLSLGDLLRQGLDQPFDARDLGSLGSFVVLGALYIVPTRVRRSVRR